MNEVMTDREWVELAEEIVSYLDDSPSQFCDFLFNSLDKDNIDNEEIQELVCEYHSMKYDENEDIWCWVRLRLDGFDKSDLSSFSYFITEVLKSSANYILSGRQDVVYFIKNSIGRIKIGYTSDFKRRFRELSLASGDDLIVLYKHYPQRTTAVALEGALHRHFSKQRLKGEWFDLSESINFKDVCALYD